MLVLWVANTFRDGEIIYQGGTRLRQIRSPILHVFLTQVK